MTIWFVALRFEAILCHGRKPFNVGIVRWCHGRFKKRRKNSCGVTSCGDHTGTPESFAELRILNFKQPPWAALAWSPCVYCRTHVRIIRSSWSGSLFLINNYESYRVTLNSDLITWPKNLPIKNDALGDIVCPINSKNRRSMWKARLYKISAGIEHEVQYYVMCFALKSLSQIPNAMDAEGID